MRWLVFILIACLALAVLRVTIIVLLIVFGLMILWGVLFRPAETFGFIALMGFMSVLQLHPLPVLILIGVLGLVALVRRPEAEPAQPILLTDQSEKEV